MPSTEIAKDATIDESWNSVEKRLMGEKLMENSQARRRPSLSATLPPSPRLRRSGSTTRSTTLSENNSCAPNSGQRSVTNPRPKSTTKSRTNKNEENVNPPLPATISSSKQKKPEENTPSKELSFGKFLQRGSPRTVGAAKGGRSVTNSPSAWALSPGRSLGCRVTSESTVGCPVRPESPGSGGRRVRGADIIGVLKYFKQKKASPLQEEEFHRFRVTQNILLQWRFANARAEAAMASVKRVTEARLFSVWIRIFKMRRAIVAKHIEMQRLRLEIKLYQIVNPHMSLLNEWAKLERRNQESVSRLVRKLLCISVTIPLVEGAKADVVSIYKALSSAVMVMDAIEETIPKFLSKQVETALYILTELKSIAEQEDEYLEELEMAIPLFGSLLVKEESVQVQLIQAAKC
ncbi:QWRF motif-containing protein 7 [Morella rubra]|uniref:QWRF motif-containing protein 7 n=1 Tax=Morella rubra TaxID=262757 RepID=A0A6A1VDE2_9ROSI|nr:QWRF motif-containing protein 7 [Morella rubra]